MKKNELRLKILFYSALIMCGIVAYLAALMGTSMGTAYYSLAVLLIPLGGLAWFFYKKKVLCQILNRLKENWGRKDDRKRDFKEIGNLFQFLGADRSDRFIIDDQTWEDLNMDLVFAELDKTLTTPGEQVLYKILRTPEFNGEVLGERKKVIKLLEQNEKVREQLYIKLYHLGRQRKSYVTSLLWGDMPPMSKFKLLYSLMAVLALVSLSLIPLLGAKVIVYIIIPLFGINFYINYRIRKNILVELTSLRYLSAIISTAGSIAKNNIEGLDSYSKSLINLSNACKGIVKKSGLLMPYQGGDYIGAIYDYLNIFFLIEVRSFYAALGEIIKHRGELKEIYMLIGELDALLSTASFRSGLTTYVEPIFTKEEAQIDAEDLRHPLLKDPVPNSIIIKQEGIIITGCNMSGKSTFLRTLGVNALFAQTILTCLAASYKASYLRVMTSISRGDNLIGGKSYYLAEAESLLRIINASDLEDEEPCLVILDEMFRGTNSIERINASAEILQHLVNHNCLAVIATHDYELTDMLRGLYKCYYFNESIEDRSISFDFKIKQGVCITRNAVKLMDYLGYPEEIIKRTNERMAAI